MKEVRRVSAELRLAQYAQSKRQALEKRTFRRLTQRPSSVQLWQTPAGSRIPKDESHAVFPPEDPLPLEVPLPEEAQDASYFADADRIDNFSANSIIHYTSV